MSSSSTRALDRERAMILAVLLVLAAGAWALLLWQAAVMPGSAMGLTMGMSAALFLAIWVAMMVAMMFPTAAPMVLMFATISRSKRERGQVFAPTWVFVSAYLAVWALCGVLAYGAAVGIQQLAMQSPWAMNNTGRLGGAVLLAAGLYQFSPLKRVCLAKCRTPLQFIMTSWHDGYAGALRMGFEHGVYCLGCCWLLFVILFPLGIMNIAVMALLTILIFAEKALPFGHQIGYAAAVVLVGYGALALVVPSVLPVML